MEKHNAIVASNILRMIDEVKKVLDFIYSIEGEKLVVRKDDCPYCIPLPTIPLQNEVYMLVKAHYEEELNDLENRLKEL